MANQLYWEIARWSLLAFVAITAGAAAKPQQRLADSPVPVRMCALDEQSPKESPGEVDEISVEIAKTATANNGKLLFVTTGGMVWKQIDGDSPKYPKPGARVVISKAALGGHWCQLNRWTAVRCERIDRPATESVTSASPRESSATAPSPSGPVQGEVAPLLAAPKDSSPPPRPPSAKASDAAVPIQGTSTKVLPAKPPGGGILAKTSIAKQENSYGLPQASQAGALPKVIQAEIAEAGIAPNGKLQFETTSGTTWRQTDGDPALPLAIGTLVTITRNSLGGHWCQLGRWNAVRCKEVR